MPRTQSARKTLPVPAPALIGQVRRFGKNGILYEVIAIEDADTVKIRVIETGEETGYDLADLMLDPSD